MTNLFWRDSLAWGAFLAPYQPSQRYFLLDAGDYTDAPPRLAEIGEWLFECASGEELLERLERARAFVPDGQEPERQPAR